MVVAGLVNVERNSGLFASRAGDLFGISIWILRLTFLLYYSLHPYGIARITQNTVIIPSASTESVEIIEYTFLARGFHI